MSIAEYLSDQCRTSTRAAAAMQGICMPSAPHGCVGCMHLPSVQSTLKPALPYSSVSLGHRHRQLSSFLANSYIAPSL